MLDVHLPNPPDDAFHGAVREASGGAVRFVGAAAGAAVFVGGRVPDAVLDSDTLRHVVVPFAGVPAALCASVAARPGLTLHNLHHNAAATAEMAVTLLLSAARCLPGADAALRRGDWSGGAAYERTLVLDGGHAVVVGYGRIGRRVGEACRALGMSVTGVTRTGRGTRRDEAGTVPVERLDDVLPDARAVLIACPLTEQTRGLFDARRLALLPERCVLVNVGRGAVVDESALYDALRARRLLGAGLDVWWRYPDAVDDPERERTWPSALPFDRLENVVMTPHNGGAYRSPELEPRRAAALGELLAGLSRGESPNRVDVAQGY